MLTTPGRVSIARTSVAWAIGKTVRRIRYEGRVRSHASTNRAGPKEYP